MTQVRGMFAARAVKDDDGRFALAITLLFLSFATASAAFHEPWRDEAQAWLLARDSSGVGSLLRSSRYEAGPILWHLLLFPLTRIGGPGLMSALNVAFAAGTAYLFARFSPFDRLSRALFAFGYLPLYEWSTLARNYAVGVFFLFLFAAAFSRRRPVLQGLALAAAANTSVHAALVSAGGFAFLVVHGLTSPQWKQRRTRLAFLAGLAVAAMGLLVSFLQILPPTGTRTVWVSPANLHRLWSVLCSFPAGFAPFADCWFATAWPLRSPWLQAPATILSSALTLAFVAAASASLAGRRAAWMVAAFSVAMLGILFFLVWWRGPRHAGFLFVAALLALWLAAFCAERRLSDGMLSRLSTRLQRSMPRVMHAVLAFHALVGGAAVAVEVGTVFSAAPATAALIRQQGLAGLPIVAAPDFAATSVVAHLGVPAVYYPQIRRWGSFTTWADHAPGDGKEIADDELVFGEAARLADASDVVVLVNRAPEARVVKRTGAGLVGAVSADIVEDESYFVYRVPARNRMP